MGTFNVTPSIWLEYAKGKPLNNLVIAYIEKHPENLYDLKKGQTPKYWEFTSNLLDRHDINLENAAKMLATVELSLKTYIDNPEVIKSFMEFAKTTS